MRISTSQLYATSLTYLNNSLSSMSDLQSEASSMKKVNKPSDDPCAMSEILKLRAQDSRNSQYLDNLSTAEGYLSLSDQMLMSVSEIITGCKELAAQCSTGTYSTDQLQSNALALEQNLEQLVTLANTQYGDNALFGGQTTDSDPYEIGLGVTVDNEDLSVDRVTVTGDTNNTDDIVCVRFDSGGDIGASELSYSYSLDAGATWTSSTLAATDSSIDIPGTDISLEFTPDDPATTVPVTADTTLYVRPAVTYKGDSEQMQIQIDENSTIGVTMDGSTIFGGLDSSGNAVTPSDENLFETLGNIIAYAQTGNQSGVASCLENLSTAHVNVTTQAALVGATENRVTFAQDSNAVLDSQIMTSISGLEDADMAELTTELTKQELIYQTVLSTCSKIMQMSLADYL